MSETKITPSGGNVFGDIGLSSPELRLEIADLKVDNAALRSRVAELEQERACVTKDRDSWREQSLAHNIDRIKGNERIAHLEAQLAEARTAFNVAGDALARAVCLGMTINQLSRIGVIQVGIERALAAVAPEAPNAPTVADSATVQSDENPPDKPLNAASVAVLNSIIQSKNGDGAYRWDESDMPEAEAPKCPTCGSTSKQHQPIALPVWCSDSWHLSACPECRANGSCASHGGQR